MSPHEESLYIENWRKVARQDWHRIRVMLADGDGDGAGFFLQQALEKYLKAYLLGHGWRLKKTHTLHSLLDDAVAFESRLDPFRPACERISGFYFAERYPSVGGEGVRTEDVNQAMPAVRELIGLLFPDEVLES